MSHYVAFADEGGIEPVVPVIASTLADEPASHFTLVYGNKASSSVRLREELMQLKDRYLDRLALIFVMSRENQDVELLNGRIDRERVAGLLERWIDPRSIDAALVSGGDEMMRDVAVALEAAGVEAARIRANGGGASEAVTANAAVADDTVTRVALVFEGKRRDFEMPRSGEPILDAALRNGIDVPYSCRSGVCGTCRATLTAGKVDIDVNYALEDYELERGAILMCQSYPVTAEVAVEVREF